jgi:thiamine-phosphate diphosphorylase/hydroxyethylthiazole kinase
MAKPSIDYSVYLVTDSTPAILGDKDLCVVVEAALRGGVTIVQYRDKTSPREVMVETAKKLHGITQAAGVPLLINDQVDVAVEVGCEGVHIGQDDIGTFYGRDSKELTDNKLSKSTRRRGSCLAPAKSLASQPAPRKKPSPPAQPEQIISA